MKRIGTGLMALLLASGLAWAQAPTPPLNEAVDVFLGPGAPSALPGKAMASSPNAMHNSDGRTSIVVRPGETLVRIVRTHFKGSPFRDEFIYQALVVLNPEAFPRKNHHVVTAGARLQLPTQADLMAMLEGHPPANHRAEQPSSAQPALAVQPAQRKPWVRFP